MKNPGSLPVPGATCPHCGCGADGATESLGSDAVPTVGDVAICAYCGGTNEYVERDGRLVLIRLDLSKLTDEERSRLLAAQATVGRVNRDLGRRWQGGEW